MGYEATGSTVEALDHKSPNPKALDPSWALDPISIRISGSIAISISISISISTTNECLQSKTSDLESQLTAAREEAVGVLGLRFRVCFRGLELV